MEETFDLKTERLTLKVLDTSAIDMLLDYLKRNYEFHKPFVPKRSSLFYTKEFQLSFLKRNQAAFIRQTSIRFHIFHIDNTDRIIGDFSYENIIKGSFMSCYMGYQMDSTELRKGYITEALTRGIAYIFDVVGLHRIEANVMPKNIASIGVLEQLGFNQEGLSKKYLQIDGRWEDHLRYVRFNRKLE